MIQKKIISNKNKIKAIKNIYKQALIDIDKIKKNRDKKIKQLMEQIDQKQIKNILKDIKNEK